FTLGTGTTFSLEIETEAYTITNSKTLEKIKIVIKDSKFETDFLNDYGKISKYLFKNPSKNRYKDFYKSKEIRSEISVLFKKSKSIKINDAELMKIINLMYVIKSNKKEEIKKLLADLKTNPENMKHTLEQKHQKYYSQLTNLLSFFGDVLTAQDGQQLAGVIDSYALPPTSYKLKRKKCHSIDLNGYVGAFAGTLTTFKNPTLSPQFAYGITAPVGVAFTWSQKKWIDNYGVSLDVVDLGNIVNHYLMTP